MDSLKTQCFLHKVFRNIHGKEGVSPPLPAGTRVARSLIGFYSGGQNAHCTEPLGPKWCLFISVTLV